jgi:diphthamide synthase (EF-2-diphthine--ammonia ligase)
MAKLLLSWSSGKDSAWALHVLRNQGAEIVALLTTIDETDRVAMHGVPRSLAVAQANAARLPLWTVTLPWPCPNAVYEERLRAALARARDSGITHVAFGDLYLQEIRDYRVRLLAGTGIEPLFPLWCTPADTAALARRMLDGGLRAILACVDQRQLPGTKAGISFDEALLDSLPAGADPCGENGEFHTFCCAGPMFREEVPVRAGDRLRTSEHFCFAELQLTHPIPLRGAP